MGRVKYRSVYQASGYIYISIQMVGKSLRISVANCPTPRIVAHHKLMTYNVNHKFVMCFVVIWKRMRKEKVNGC